MYSRMFNQLSLINGHISHFAWADSRYVELDTVIDKPVNITGKAPSWLYRMKISHSWSQQGLLSPFALFVRVNHHVPSHMHSLLDPQRASKNSRARWTTEVLGFHDSTFTSTKKNEMVLGCDTRMFPEQKRAHTDMHSNKMFVYVNMYIYIYIHTYTHTHIYISVCVCASKCVHALHKT